MTIHRLSIAGQVTGPEALRCPELHDFSDLSEVVRGNRLLLVVLAIGTMLTAGISSIMARLRQWMRARLSKALS